MTFHR